MLLKKLTALLPILLLCAAAFGQGTPVRGKVKDAKTGEPLIGASVKFIGAQGGAVTDETGSFIIRPPDNVKALEVSYTGYVTIRHDLDGSKNIQIKLQVNEMLLNEVVVIGYGSVKKSDVTGAVESLKPKDSEVAQYDNLQDFLQGRAKGVYVQSNTNELLAPNTIRIRGGNSLRGDNEPLYVVDGIIVNSGTEDAADPLTGGSSYLSPQNALSNINPQDIESIEVLKDASATAIYGSRGANGVIIITTKRGKDNEAKKPIVNYKLTTRVGSPTRLINVLDPNQYVNYQNEYRETLGFKALYYTYADGSITNFVNDTAFMESKADSLPRLSPINWYDEVLRNSVSQNHHISISGAKEKADYYLAAGHLLANGNVPGTRLQQTDFLLNFNQELSSRWTLSPRLSASYITNSASKGVENLASVNTSLSRQIILASPFLGDAVNNVDGTFDEVIDGPNTWIYDYNDDSKEYRALLSLKSDYKINRFLTYRFLAGADYRSKKRQLWFGKSTARGYLANGEAGVSDFDRFRYNVDNTLLFNKKINRSNEISGTVGFVLDATRLEQSTFTATNFANQALRYDGILVSGRPFSPCAIIGLVKPLCLI
jgi:TonB-dependent starch-binding outer membrane protein SusC